MIRKLAVIVASGMLAFSPLAASAQIIPGTELVGTLDQDISSASAQVGTGFTLSNVHSQNRNINGAKVYGHVASVERAGQGRPGKIQLAYDKINTAAGNVYTLNGTTVSAQTNTKNNTLKEVGGAVGGMIVGNIIGKAVGVGVGGLLGAGGGYMLAKNSRENVTIPKNSTVVLQVTRSLRQTR